jgi:hypothetical protein
MGSRRGIRRALSVGNPLGIGSFNRWKSRMRRQGSNFRVAPVKYKDWKSNRGYYSS